MKKLVILALLIMVGSAFAYHEFSVPKKAYKKVTIEYFSNDDQITSPCSTVYLYYDKSDVEMYREVKKGCCNPVSGWEIFTDPYWDADSLSVGFGVDSVTILDLIRKEIIH